MNRRTLPVQQPLFACMPMDANIQSIILTEKSLYPWLMSQFIQLWGCDPNMEDFFIYYLNTSYWFSCPYLMTQEISKEVVGKITNSIITFIINALDLDYYVVLPIDQFYIPMYQNNAHRPHELMIYGYDKDKMEFDIADFFMYKDTNKYMFMKCSFSMLNNAYYCPNDCYSWDGIIRLAKLDIYGKHPEFSIAVMRSFDFTIVQKLLLDYINRSNSQLRFHMPHIKGDAYSCRVGGLAVYDILLQYTDNALRNEDKCTYIDLRPFYVVYSHKIMAHLRIKFLKSILGNKIPDSLISSFALDEQKAKRLLLIILKSNMTDKFDFSTSEIAYIINDLVKTEKTNISLLLDIIEKNLHMNPTIVDKPFDPTRKYNQIE